MYSLITDYFLDSYALSFKPYTWSLKEAVVWMFVHIKLNAVKCGKPQKSFVSFLTTVSCIRIPVNPRQFCNHDHIGMNMTFAQDMMLTKKRQSVI